MVREWQGNKGVTNLDRIEAGEGTSLALQMVREWQENKGLETGAGKRRAQNDGTNVLATDHLLPFPTLLFAKQLSVLAMASEPRFAVNTDAEINQLLKEAVPPNTRKSTDVGCCIQQVLFRAGH